MYYLHIIFFKRIYCLSTGLRQDIISQLTQGKSVSEVAKNFNTSESKVEKLPKKNLPDYEVKKGGRLIKLSQLQRNFVLEHLPPKV